MLKLVDRVIPVNSSIVASLINRWLLKVEFKQLPPLITGRFAHACGSYSVANTKVLYVSWYETNFPYYITLPWLLVWKPCIFLSKTQMLIVTGGNDGGERLASTEVVCSNSSDSFSISSHSSPIFHFISSKSSHFPCYLSIPLKTSPIVNSFFFDSFTSWWSILL